METLAQSMLDITQQHAPKELHALLFAVLDGNAIDSIIASRLRASYRAIPTIALVEDDA